MVRYLGAKLKIIRKLGALPGWTKKSSKIRQKTPGQHGKSLVSETNRSSLADDYSKQLFEKQKLRFNYGITEKQLLAYYQKAKVNKTSTMRILLEQLESRLDCIIYRLGFAPTIPAARQIINHCHVRVNSKVVNISSFLCSVNDIISPNTHEKSFNLLKKNFNTQQQQSTLITNRIKKINLTKSYFNSILPAHLQVDKDTLIAKVISRIKKKDIIVKIDVLKVIEYYSR